MNVICTDGTHFNCDTYELTEKGVKLYKGAPDGESRYGSDDDEHQIGFVPEERLLYILPDGVQPAQAPAQRPQGQQTPAQQRQGKQTQGPPPQR